MSEKIKAYEVINDYDGISDIVFAENLAKARYFAFQCTEHDCTSFIEYAQTYKVSRCREADKAYKGRGVMDWDEPDDRLFLVKELGWMCYEEPYDDCGECIAHEYCELGKQYIEEENMEKRLEAST